MILDRRFLRHWSLRGQSFAQLEPFENTTRLFFFVNEAGRRLQVEPAEVRQRGDRNSY